MKYLKTALVLALCATTAAVSARPSGSTSTSTTTIPSDTLSVTQPEKSESARPSDVTRVATALEMLRGTTPLRLTIDTGYQRTVLTRDAAGSTSMLAESSAEGSPVTSLEYRLVGGVFYARGFPSKNAPTGEKKWLNVSIYLKTHTTMPKEWLFADGVFSMAAWADRIQSSKVFLSSVDPIDGFFGMTSTDCLASGTVANVSKDTFSVKCSSELPDVTLTLDGNKLTSVSLQGTTARYEHNAIARITAP